jgi:hypothetical protein
VLRCVSRSASIRPRKTFGGRDRRFRLWFGGASARWRTPAGRAPVGRLVSRYVSLRPPVRDLRVGVISWVPANHRI